MDQTDQFQDKCEWLVFLKCGFKLWFNGILLFFLVSLSNSSGGRQSVWFARRLMATEFVC
jgi:hypothetical protein